MRYLATSLLGLALALGSVPAGAAGGASKHAEASTTALLSRFAGTDLTAVEPPALPYTADVPALGGSRALDVGLALLVLVVLYGTGLRLRKAAIKIHPAVFAAVILGILMFTVVNPSFWEVKGVRIDEEGLTLARYAKGDLQIAWKDVHTLRYESGDPFPAFSDDSTLVLVGRDGAEVPIPRFVPEPRLIGAAIRANLPKSLSSRRGAHP